MTRKQFCGSPEHSIDRRLFLQGGLTTALGVSLMGLGAPRQAWAAGLVLLALILIVNILARAILARGTAVPRS